MLTNENKKLSNISFFYNSQKKNKKTKNVKEFHKFVNVSLKFH